FSKKEFYEIELYDLTGRLVLKINRRMEEDYLEILTMQPKTFYIIKISGLQGQQVFKHYFL
ncbi:MAG: T9SS type A sorting domain-containing protein, partial [Nonlabens ulvanivorans]